MIHSRTFSAIAVQALLLLVMLTVQNSHVTAQFGFSVPCNNCLTTQLGTIPSCAGVNMTDSSQRSTPQYRTCLCDSSFDFSWTKGCTNTCQATEIQSLQNGYPELLKTGLNLTCVKPSPSPTATPSAATEAQTIIGWTTMAFVTLAALLCAA
ncbi:hypothetical protein B0O80DRAFT_421489 [Mortierella sp. GBAus27b]|nr:hypothetical protein B0O80DRAFT_421489 [Mortierella sp. GBAus27b]